VREIGGEIRWERGRVGEGKSSSPNLLTPLAVKSVGYGTRHSKKLGYGYPSNPLKLCL